MALSKAQIQALTNPQVRQRLPTKRADFQYADDLLKDVGETCPRLPAVYDRIFYGLDAQTAKWLNGQFPGLGFTSSTTATPPPPQNAMPRTLVSKAIDVLQSFKKS